jgi:DNA replication ATP-dependent helicase Dna2
VHKLQPELTTPFLRIGKSSRIHPQVYAQSADQKLTFDSETTTLGQHLSNFYQSVSLVATTCLGINHPSITTKRHPFDYCILDEAGQCLLLSALGPLFHAKKFVFVGDPHQLPPLVQSQKAQGKGMDISLFSHLATKPDNIIPLTI